MDDIENTPDTEVAPQEVETQDDEVVTTDEVTDSPAEAAGTEKKLILGKFESQEALEKSYLELQGYMTKQNQSLKDPNYVYQLAKQAGLTDEQATAQANQTQPQRDPVEVYKDMKDYDKAVEILPELATKPGIEAWGRALVDGGMGHEQAARYIKSELESNLTVAKAEGAKSMEKAITAKEAAQTAPTIGSVEKDELTEINEKISSATGSEREKLLEQKIMLRLK